MGHPGQICNGMYYMRRQEYNCFAAFDHSHLLAEMPSHEWQTAQARFAVRVRRHLLCKKTTDDGRLAVAQGEPMGEHTRAIAGASRIVLIVPTYVEVNHAIGCHIRSDLEDSSRLGCGGACVHGAQFAQDQF